MWNLYFFFIIRWFLSQPNQLWFFFFALSLLPLGFTSNSSWCCLHLINWLIVLHFIYYYYFMFSCLPQYYTLPLHFLIKYHYFNCGKPSRAWLYLVSLPLLEAVLSLQILQCILSSNLYCGVCVKHVRRGHINKHARLWHEINTDNRDVTTCNSRRVGVGVHSLISAVIPSNPVVLHTDVRQR